MNLVTVVNVFVTPGEQCLPVGKLSLGSKSKFCLTLSIFSSWPHIELFSRLADWGFECRIGVDTLDDLSNLIVVALYNFATTRCEQMETKPIRQRRPTSAPIHRKPPKPPPLTSKPQILPNEIETDHRQQLPRDMKRVKKCMTRPPIRFPAPPFLPSESIEQLERSKESARRASFSTVIDMNANQCSLKCAQPLQHSRHKSYSSLERGFAKRLLSAAAFASSVDSSLVKFSGLQSSEKSESSSYKSGFTTYIANYDDYLARSTVQKEVDALCSLFKRCGGDDWLRRGGWAHLRSFRTFIDSDRIAPSAHVRVFEDFSIMDDFVYEIDSYGMPANIDGVIFRNGRVCEIELKENNLSGSHYLLCYSLLCSALL